MALAELSVIWRYTSNGTSVVAGLSDIRPLEVTVNQEGKVCPETKVQVRKLPP